MRYWTRPAFLSLGLLALGPRPLGSQQLDTILVGGPPAEPLKTVYYAERSGLFRKYGLDVDVQLIASGNAAMAAVVGGTIDLGHASLLSTFQGYRRGVGFVIVAPSGLYLTDNPQAILIVKKDSPIKTGRDLDNQVIGAGSLQDFAAAATMGWIDQHGGDSKTVKVIELTNSSVVAAIEQGRIAAATVTAPYKDIAIQSGVARELGKSFDSVAKTFMVSGYIGYADAVAKKRDAMRRFALAMHESILYCNTHPNEMVDLIASYTNISHDVIEKSPRTVDPEYVEPKLIQPFIDFAAKYGLIDRSFDAANVISDVAVKPGA